MIFTNAFTTGIKFTFVFATSQDFALYMYADIMLCSSLTFLYSYLYYLNLCFQFFQFFTWQI